MRPQVYYCIQQGQEIGVIRTKSWIRYLDAVCHFKSFPNAGNAIFGMPCEHLKEVHIGGFNIGRFRIGGLCEDSSFLQLSAYFLNTAVGLERLIIDPQCNIYDGANQWDRRYGRVTWEEGEREKVWTIFKTHRKSSSVVVML